MSYYDFKAAVEAEESKYHKCDVCGISSGDYRYLKTPDAEIVCEECFKEEIEEIMTHSTWLMEMADLCGWEELND